MTTDETTETTKAPAAVRDRLAIALDVDDIVVAHRLAKEVAPWFGVAKVGLELFSAHGPAAINQLVGLGYKVFLDLKLHDIPTTVEKAARVVGSLGVSYLTIHAVGGAPMLRGGVEGLRDGAAAAGLEPPCALAVTILTSDAARRRTSSATGCGPRWRPGAAAWCARRAMYARPSSWRHG